MNQIDATEKKRIRWRSRRGLLELDIVLERFLARGFDDLTQAQLADYRRLLELDDNDFLDVVNGKADLDDAALMAIVHQLRAV
ncbi:MULTISPECIES: succinate dehydrogenase assembly factor 2 [unclassified Paludibacterium]|uniref:FAD assembly factor SdhE n=1 Tax=unclassified Paludibacterium TaxID=2618429 RepID=UPI001C04116D|nr:succinate dehydrogenase assembly factor 2 [Paludibacterium sp. B53371]BEV73677.1 succinate dehydrogenase assembly factor 2 [Paludibacterium sp. THUN1379]